MAENRFNYRIIYSRRKTLCITIRHGEGVIVRAPSRISEKEIDRFVNEKSEWIIKHLRAQQSRIPTERDRYSEGDLYMLGGREYKIELAASDRWIIKFDGEKILIECQDRNDSEIISLMLNRFFSKYAARVITGSFNDILIKLNGHGLRPTALKIRKMKSKWGSCSTKGSITINSQLARLEPRFLEYVIIHELCHLRHHNHGQMFYALLSQLFPDWHNTRKELKRYQG